MATLVWLAQGPEDKHATAAICADRALGNACDRLLCSDSSITSVGRWCALLFIGVRAYHSDVWQHGERIRHQGYPLCGNIVRASILG